MSLLSQDIENQPITSPKYTVIMLRLRQNEHNMAFGMLVARNSVIRVAKLFGSFRIIGPSLVKRYKQTGISIDASRSGDVSQRHREKTFLRINVSGSSRQL